jgi:glycerophosphoryl diester phosphodiesterase
MPMPATSVEIIAHRGASADAPENTLAAFKLGYAQGADGVELDIHFTKDGKLVAIHDDDTQRVAGVARRVADQTFAEIRGLGVGSFGNWKGKGFVETVPTLDEVLDVVPQGRKLYIEIKGGEEILPALADRLSASSLTTRQTVIITFHYEVVRVARKMFPGRQVYWLVEYAKDDRTGRYPELDDLIVKAKAANADGLNLEHEFPLDEAALRKVHGAGLKCVVWTLDDPGKARKLIRAGVDAITTNRPGTLRRQLHTE